MQVKVKFTLETDDNSQKSPAGKAVGKIKSQLGKYATKEKLIGEKIYLIEQDNPIYQQAMDVYYQNKGDVELTVLGYTVELNEKDELTAVAYSNIIPENYCEEYDDLGYEYQGCSNCEMRERSEDTFFVLPRGYIKRKQKDYGIAWLDDCHEAVLLPKLVQELKDAGINENHFLPVFSKKKSILGYVFDTSNILPKSSYEDPNYELNKTCSKCGAVTLNENEEIFIQHPKTITQEGLDQLQDINFTYEYYDGYRELIISPKVYSIIRKYVKDVSFMPVYLR